MTSSGRHPVHHLPETDDLTPLPDRGRGLNWWQRLRRRWRCRREIGHCWHLHWDSFHDWWCCECDADTSGAPPDNCIWCRGRR